MKRITSLVLALLLVLSSSLALAADFDLKIVETGEVKDFLDWPFNDSLYLDVVLGEEEGKYLIEYDDSFYRAEEVVKASEENPNADLGELVKDLEPVEEVPGEDLEVLEVSAINPTTIKVVFNQEVEELVRTDVVVRNVKTSDRQYVKEVKLAEDKKSAEVVFYDALVTKNTYKVVVDEAEKEFDYVVGDAAKIEAETVQIVKPITEQTNLKDVVEFKVLDANGLDITDITDVEFESTASKDGKTIDELAAGKQTFVYVVVKDKDGKELAKSERITVKAEDAKAVKLLDYAVADKAPNFEKDEIVKTVRSDDKDDKAKLLFLNLEDQFGKSIGQDGVKFESLNKEVALVDQNSGKITPLKVGTVDVRVTIGDVNEIIQITVEEAAKVASIELDKAEINLSDKLAEGQDVKVTVKDQYGEKATDAKGKVTFEVKEGNEIITVEEKSANGPEATFTIKPVEGKEGKAVVEFSYKVDEETFKTTLTVNVAKADVVDNYVVEGFEKELDKYEGKDKKNITSMTLKVFGVDANGVKTGEVTENLSIKVYDKDDKEVTGAFDSDDTAKIVVTNLTEDETYKVVVKVGTLTIFEDTFTVVDTEPEEAKPVVEQIKSSIKIESFETGKDTLKNALKKAFKVIDKDGNDVDITKFTYLSDNAAVIDGTGIKGSGTATLVITKINDDIEVPNLMVNVTVGTPFKAVKGEEKTVFTFGKFEAASGELKQLELDIYLGDNTGADRVYENDGRVSMNIPVLTSENLDKAVGFVYDWAVKKYEEATDSEKLFFEAIGYDDAAEAEEEVVKAAIKENFSYENGVWTIKLANDKLSEIGTIEFAVSVTDNQGGRLWENNYSLNDGKDFKVFSYKAQ